MVKDFQNTTCSNINPGEPIGFKGWYARGQVYAALSVDIGIRVKVNLGIIKIDKSFNLVGVDVGVALLGEFPKPAYFEGRVALALRVMDIITVHETFTAQIGKRCDFVLDAGALDLQQAATDNILHSIPIGTQSSSSIRCNDCLLYTSPSPRDQRGSRMPSSA